MKAPASSVTENAKVQPMVEEAHQRMLEEARSSFKSPSWGAHFAGAIMAMCGGMINSISFLDLGSHFFVSHLTGDTTHVGMRLAGYDNVANSKQKAADAEEAATTAFAVLIIVAFCTGAAISGCFISRNAVSVGRSAYGLVLLIAASLLVVAAFGDITAGKPIGALCAAMACGIQNGMVTTYSGAIIRTTHVTGTWTDAGLSVGRVLGRLVSKGRNLSPVDKAYLKADFQRGRLMFTLALFFCGGCFIGGNLHRGSLQKKALLIPASILACGGLAHAYYVAFVLHIGFWQLLKTSRQQDEGAPGQQVFLCVDGEVHDISNLSQPLNVSARDALIDTSSVLEGLPKEMEEGNLNSGPGAAM